MGKALKVTFVVLCMLIALVAGTVYAQVSVSNVALGDDNQERDENVTKTFTIKNNFNESITINQITPSADAKYLLEDSGLSLPSSLASGATATVTLKGYVTEDLDAVDNDFEPRAMTIGTVDVSYTRASGPTGSASGSVTMQAENMLDFKEVDIEITGDITDKSGSVTDGKTFDLDPGDTVTITVTAENDYSSSSKIDIDDVKLKIEIDEDGDFNIDDESHTTNIDAGDDDSDLEFDIEVEEDADDENHEVTITLEGRDENGALHGEVIQFDLNIERETHDMRVQRFEVSPMRVSCQNSVSYLDASVRVVNRGSRSSEKNAAVRITVPQIQFTETTPSFEVDRDDEVRKSFTITLPDDLSSGPLKIKAEALFADTMSSDSEEIVVIVDECTPDEPATPPETVTPPTTPPSTPPSAPPSAGVVSQPTSSSGAVSATPTSGSSFGSSSGYVVLLIILIVLVLVGILLMVGILLVRKK